MTLFFVQSCRIFSINNPFGEIISQSCVEILSPSTTQQQTWVFYFYLRVDGRRPNGCWCGCSMCVIYRVEYWTLRGAVASKLLQALRDFSPIEAHPRNTIEIISTLLWRMWVECLQVILNMMFQLHGKWREIGWNIVALCST